MTVRYGMVVNITGILVIVLGFCGHVYSALFRKNCTISLAEYQALEALYDGLNGPSWSWNDDMYAYTQWDFPPDGEVDVLALEAPCYNGWQGVTCQVIIANVSRPNCSVVGLDLRGLGLVGSLPSEVGALTKLSSLVLSSNNLTNTLPSEVGTLQLLTVLEISSNNINGSLPASIYRLLNLEYLLAGNTNVTGTWNFSWPFM
jgi:hypothetical protein